jgi:hypothetical protein
MKCWLCDHIGYRPGGRKRQFNWWLLHKAAGLNTKGTTHDEDTR